MSCASIILSLFATIILLSALQINAFITAPLNNGYARTASSLSMAETSSTTNTKKTTLTTDTTWRLRLLLNDITTTKGKKLDNTLFVVEGNFIEEEGYEPPQGLFKPTVKEVSLSEDGEEASNKNTMALEVTNSRWTLSEDPNDRKDGLWIWGLFKEPQYPFMLLQMETSELKLPSSDSDESDSVPALKLYAQINHIRDRDENGSGVELQSANLNVRILEQVQLPGATVDLYEEEAVGQISFQPL